MTTCNSPEGLALGLSRPLWAAFEGMFGQAADSAKAWALRCDLMKNRSGLFNKITLGVYPMFV
jgi:hypothetical protein